MQTRLMVIIAIVGLGVIWIGFQQSDKIVPIIGIILFLVGLVGAHMSIRNKKGMGFLRRL